VAAQEVVERLRTDSGEESDGDGESEGMSLAVQLIRLQSLFAKGMSRSYLPCWRERTIMPFFHIQAFPRLVLRKSPSQTLVPVAELGQLLSPAAKYAMVAEGRSLVRGAALMVQELGTWVKEKAGDDLPELTTSHVSGWAYPPPRPFVYSGSTLSEICFMTGPSGVLPERRGGNMRRSRCKLYRTKSLRGVFSAPELSLRHPPRLERRTGCVAPCLGAFFI
jgi:hypothetical protein